MWENLAAAGWGPDEIADALYELTDNHMTALRENEALDLRLAGSKGRC